MEQYELIWEKTKKNLESTISAVSHQTWIQTLKAVDIRGNKLVLHADSTLVATRIAERYLPEIREALFKVTPILTDIELTVGDSDDDVLKDSPAPENQAAKSMELNPKYTFDSFVVGSSNKFVHAAALAVAENPGEAYNPLFIYGGTGLGKTHIMHAIGNYIKKNHPNLRIIYVTGEFFTNELIDSIKAGRKSGGDFRSKYRNSVHRQQTVHTGRIFPYL